jgi:hypothetical protein
LTMRARSLGFRCRREAEASRRGRAGRIPDVLING